MSLLLLLLGLFFHTFAKDTTKLRPFLQVFVSLISFLSLWKVVCVCVCVCVSLSLWASIPKSSTANLRSYFCTPTKHNPVSSTTNLWYPKASFDHPMSHCCIPLRNCFQQGISLLCFFPFYSLSLSLRWETRTRDKLPRNQFFYFALSF